MSMNAYFRSDSESKLHIRMSDDRHWLTVAACDKHGFMRDSVSLMLTSAERDAAVAALQSMDCSEADGYAAEIAEVEA